MTARRVAPTPTPSLCAQAIAAVANCTTRGSAAGAAFVRISASEPAGKDADGPDAETAVGVATAASAARQVTAIISAPRKLVRVIRKSCRAAASYPIDR